MVSYWSGEVPDRIAIVSEHGNRTFGELNARANQLVRALRAPGRRARRRARAHVPQPPRVRRGVGGVQPRRLPPHADQLAPHRRGSGLHRRRLRGAGDRRRRARTRRARPGAARRAPGRHRPARDRRRHRRVRVVRGRARGRGRRQHRRPRPRRPDALHVGHDRPAQGRHRQAGLAAAPTTAAATATVASTARHVSSYVPGDDLHLCTGPLYHAAPLAFSLSLPLASGVRRRADGRLGRARRRCG